MRIEMAKVVEGVKRYLAKEIYPGMTDWQEVAANVAVKNLVRYVASMYGEVMVTGLIDAEVIIDDLKEEISRKGKVEVKPPLLGKMTFLPEDMDKLKAEIYGGVMNDQVN